MTKFHLLGESKINKYGVKLFRLVAGFDIPSKDINAGDKGGWIEKLSNVNGNAWVSGNAWVYGNAQVSGDAWVYGDALVSGNAEVSGNARVSGDAQVYGDALVYGNARVCNKLAYTQGKFVGGMNGPDKVTNITEKMGTTILDNQYVLGDYEITEIEEKAEETILIGDKKYLVTEELKEALKNLKEKDDDQL